MNLHDLEPPLHRGIPLFRWDEFIDLNPDADPNHYQESEGELHDMWFEGPGNGVMFLYGLWGRKDSPARWVIRVAEVEYALGQYYPSPRDYAYLLWTHSTSVTKPSAHWTGYFAQAPQRYDTRIPFWDYVNIHDDALLLATAR